MHDENYWLPDKEGLSAKGFLILLVKIAGRWGGSGKQMHGVQAKEVVDGCAG